jgi:hypothetical protein
LLSCPGWNSLFLIWAFQVLGWPLSGLNYLFWLSTIYYLLKIILLLSHLRTSPKPSSQVFFPRIFLKVS